MQIKFILNLYKAYAWKTHLINSIFDSFDNFDTKICIFYYYQNSKENIQVLEFLYFDLDNLW